MSSRPSRSCPRAVVKRSRVVALDFGLESQRDSDPKPKGCACHAVAQRRREERATLGRPVKANNLNGVAVWCKRGTTPLGLKNTRPETQGSSFLARPP